MAATTTWYGLGMKNVQAGLVDLDSDTFKCMLTTSAYTPDQDAHQYRSSVTNEVAGAGYSAGGVTLSGVSLTYDTASNEIRLDFNDPSWAAASFTARYAVVYKSRGGAAGADELLCFIDFGADQTVGGATFTIQLAATGLLKTTV